MSISDTPSANVDHNEIDKFSALAERWWDPEGEFKPLHAINPLRLDFIDARVGLAGREVLDVGCGDAFFGRRFVQSGAFDEVDVD